MSYTNVNLSLEIKADKEIVHAPSSILKTSNLWKKKNSSVNVIKLGEDIGVVSSSAIHSPLSVSVAAQSEDDDEASSEAEDVIKVRISNKIIDRFDFKRAHTNKKKLKNDSELAERILAALAMEASGQETNT